MTGDTFILSAAFGLAMTMTGFVAGRRTLFRAHAALSIFFCMWISAAALAQSDLWRKCRDADPDLRIAGCTEIIARGARETRHSQSAAYERRAAAYLAKGDLDLAIADYDRALRINKNFVTAHVGRAKAYRDQGALDKSLADFDAALALEPNHASLYADRGAIYKAKGDFDRAIADFSNAIALDPNFTEAFVNRAAAFRGKQDIQRAKEDLEQALKLAPQSSAAKDALDEVDRLIASKAPPPVTAPTTPPASTANAPASRVEKPSPLASSVLFHVGPVAITRPVVTTWGIMLVLSVGAWLATRRLKPRPDRVGAVIEVVVTAIMGQIEDVIRRDPRPYLPLLGTLFIFVATANLAGILPGAEAPTSKLETPAALALIVFISVHYFGVRTQGLLGYLASFAKPRLIMLPLNIVSQVTRTFSLMVRLFGNVMSGEFVIALVVALAGLFAPVPLMALEILVGLVQAYIFVVLATVFIGAAIGAVEQG
jgi:F-type H+-transporting ATPase subunit a